MIGSLRRNSRDSNRRAFHQEREDEPILYSLGTDMRSQGFLVGTQTD